MLIPAEQEDILERTIGNSMNIPFLATVWRTEKRNRIWVIIELKSGSY
jgi:hypothetical protein